jgi:succinoglycan biosynthesis transport protein ExoP
MNLQQIIRILFVRKFLIIASTFASLCGALLVVIVLPPRWQGHARVVLGDLKPDPVTGMVAPSAGADTYIATQVELVTDYTVAEHVAQLLGWLSDPQLIQFYDNRPKSDDRDYSRWLAQLVINRTTVQVLRDTNIMEITYTGATPDNARIVADAVRTAYLDQSVNFHRQDALKTAAFFDAEAAKAKTLLDAATDREAQYERENGLVMQDATTDVDTARLRSAAANVAPAPPPPRFTPSNTAAELAQLDASIGQAEKNLGPNNPDLLAMKSKRASLASLAAREEAAQKSAASSQGSLNSAGLDRTVQTLKTRVLAQSGKLARLQQLQSDVDLQRDELNRALARSAELRREAAVTNVGITPIGEAIAPEQPSFPNKPLIFIGALILGLVSGSEAAVLTELIARRVRGPQDLSEISDVPLIAVIDRSKPGWRWQFSDLFKGGARKRNSKGRFNSGDTIRA